MSIKLMAEVWSKDLSASQQRVLLVLCDHANDQGINCYPSTDYIGWKLGVRRSTVSNTITELEKMGAIQVRRDHRKVNHYRIRLDRIPTKAPFAKAIYEVEEWGDDENLALENRTQENSDENLALENRTHSVGKPNANDGNSNATCGENPTLTIIEPSVEPSVESPSVVIDITTRASDEAPVGANAPTPANAGVLPPQEDSSLTGMKNLGKRVSGKQSTQKEPGSAAAAPTDRRVWAMVTAYHEALKVDDHSVPTRTRHQVYKIFAGLPSWVGETAIRGCVQYIQSDPFWREPGRTTADKVAKTVLEWDAAGRPTSIVGQKRGHTQAVVEVTRSYIEQWDGPAGGDDTNMIEG